MVSTGALAACVSEYVSSVVLSSDAMTLLGQLQDPILAADAYEGAFRTVLDAAGINVSALQQAARDLPYLHLRAAFDPDGLPETPVQWFPVPNIRATLAARLAILLINRVLGMETISYGSENDGELFVNLVALKGDGLMAQKSMGPMQGHTDAATFPFRGTRDPEHPRIAPSPDLVYLAALRNPDEVATVVMPLECALAALSDDYVQVLKGPHMVLRSQRSFELGTKSAIGKVHMLDGTHVLFDSPEGVWVRYTHTNSAVYDDEDEIAVKAKGKFEAACLGCRESIVLTPGDLLLVNNRKALHGRLPVGEGIGGNTRWLLRSYGLDTSELHDEQRHPSSRHKLYP